MNARTLQRRLTLFSHYTEGEIDQRTRPLREHKMIPFGPRGRHAPDIEPLHAALMILTMVSRRAADGGKIAMRSMDLEAVKYPEGCELIEDGTPLAVALAAALTPLSLHFQKLEVATDGSRAWFTVEDRDGKVKTILFTNDLETRSAAQRSAQTYANQGAATCGHRFVLGTGVIKQIGIELSEKEPDNAGVIVDE